MLVRFKCSHCDNLTNPIDLELLPTNQIINCTNTNCLKQFSVIGVESLFVRSPHLATNNITNSLTHKIQFSEGDWSLKYKMRPNSILGLSIIESACKFIMEGNPKWTKDEVIYQCQNHLKIKYPNLLDYEATYATKTGKARIDYLNSSEFIFRYEIDLTLSTADALCITRSNGCGDNIRQIEFIIPTSFIAKNQLELDLLYPDPSLPHNYYNKEEQLSKQVELFPGHRMNFLPKTIRGQEILNSAIRFLETQDIQAWTNKSVTKACPYFLERIHKDLLHDEAVFATLLAKAIIEANLCNHSQYNVDILLSTPYSIYIYRDVDEMDIVPLVKILNSNLFDYCVNLPTIH